MDVQAATDQMIRISRVLDSYSEAAQISQLVTLADKLYQQARYSVMRQWQQTMANDAFSRDISGGALRRADVDSVLESTPIGMAYRAVVQKAWYLACG